MVARLLATTFIFLVVLFVTNDASAQSAYPSLLPTFNSLPINSEQTVGTVTVDLVVEADTYVPYFYRGRREPTPGSKLRLIALSNGAVGSAVYQWQVADQYLTTTSNVLEIEMHKIGSEFSISVQVIGQGRQLGSATTYLKPSEPKVLFYQDNELRGLSSVALAENVPLVGDEISVQAEPYFLSTSSLFTGASGTWSVGTDLSLVPDSDWRKVTVVRNETTSNLSETKVNLKVSNVKNPSETLNGIFKLGL